MRAWGRAAGRARGSDGQRPAEHERVSPSGGPRAPGPAGAATATGLNGTSIAGPLHVGAGSPTPAAGDCRTNRARAVMGRRGPWLHGRKDWRRVCVGARAVRAAFQLAPRPSQSTTQVVHSNSLSNGFYFARLLRCDVWILIWTYKIKHIVC